MPLVNFSNLDFDQIKTTLKDYLQTNANFTDYDFEGSNLSTVIDLLAYNTYITSYNANMVSNEVFIDSASLRENIVSLARNIGYLPRSRTASTATVSFFVDVTGVTPAPATITLNKGPVASSAGQTGVNSYVFCILEDIYGQTLSAVAFNQESSLIGEALFSNKVFNVAGKLDLYKSGEKMSPQLIIEDILIL